MSVNETAPVSAPSASGLNETLISQVAPGATELPFAQGVTFLVALTATSAKSPLTAMEAGVRAMLPVLTTVMVIALLVELMLWLAKVYEVGLTVAALRAVPAVNSGVCQMPRP